MRGSFVYSIKPKCDISNQAKGKSRILYWCDSTITLAWINTDPSRLKTFVSNRVAKIQTISNPNQWIHVPTQQNPADIISRGVTPRDMLNKFMV